MVKSKNYFFYILLLLSINDSYSQLFINFNRQGNEGDIVTREVYTMRDRDGTPITITRIGIHRNLKSRDFNSQKQTPMDLVRFMDSRMDEIFEAMIRQQFGLNMLFGEQKNNNNENENKESTKDETDKIEDKDLELDNEEEKKKSNTTNESKIADNQTNENNIDDKKKEEKTFNENKKDAPNKKEDKTNKKMGIMSKMKKDIEKKKNNNNNPHNSLKKKSLTRKEIIFSRICKYIFYSIILFTIYILLRKLLEVLEIISPEENNDSNEVKINNNKEEKEIKKVDEEKLNKMKENKAN